ncbi:hypothetical protein GCM10009558_087800 [Virgisporangium aurantiacum]
MPVEQVRVVADVPVVDQVPARPLDHCRGDRADGVPHLPEGGPAAGDHLVAGHQQTDAGSPAHRHLVHAGLGDRAEHGRRHDATGGHDLVTRAEVLPGRPDVAAILDRTGHEIVDVVAPFVRNDGPGTGRHHGTGADLHRRARRQGVRHRRPAGKDPADHPPR